MSNPADRLHQALKHFFGYDQFRLNQQHVIESVLNSEDVLAIMPTGGGKSICYQLPALLLPGITIVVSPLIALMKDQVDALQANGIGAEFLNSTQSPEEQRYIMQQAREGQVKLLYIAPERIPANKQAFFDFLKELNPSLFAIDEAHCISAWGHDFRPEYLKLAALKQQFPHVPVIALTASADSLTQKDIVDKLALVQPEIYISSFNRPNIHYIIRPKKNALAQIMEYLRQHPDDNGIIYALSRSSTEDIAKTLRAGMISASHYHAGMESSERGKVQEAFKRDEMRVIVATIAFGMGIDKSNVRFVIHHDVPKNIEGYYQETGRAGRDGLRSDAILYYSAGDILKLKRFLEIDGNPEQTKVANKKLRQMQDFCETDSCRRQYLLQYFGEPAPSYCGSCDFCLSTLEEKDVTEDAQKLLSAIARTGERFGAGYIIDFLRGSASEKISFAHKDLKTYGVGKHLKKEEWQWMIKLMLQQKMIEKSDDMYSVLKLNPSSWSILRGTSEVKLVMKKEEVQETIVDAGYEQALLKILRTRRTALAEKENVPPYVIVADNTLLEMATYLPLSSEELKLISGFGDYKVSKYGASFLKEISAYCHENKLVSKIYLKKPKKEKARPKDKQPAISKTFQVSLEMHREGLSLSVIAKQRNLALSTIENHLAMFISTGAVNIKEFIPDTKLKKILDVIKTTDNLEIVKPIKDKLDEDVTYGEIRMAIEHFKKG